MLHPRRILIVRPSALGDVLRSVPVLWSLRTAFPTADIDWIVEDRWVDAIRASPALSKAISFPKARFRKVVWNPLVGIEAIRWFIALGRQPYDIAIDAQGLARSALMSLASRAPTRVGARSSLEGSWVMANRRVDAPSGSHTVERMLALVEAVGATAKADMRLTAPPESMLSWRSRRDELGITGKYILVAAGNRWPGKRWLSQRWRDSLQQLAPDLAHSGIADIVWIGGASELLQISECVPPHLGNGVRHHILAGSTTVGETMAAVASSSLVISLDSAPAHMAVGFDVPVVSLYGASDPERDGPYGHRAWCLHGAGGVSLPPRAHRDERVGLAMMEKITVDALVRLVQRRLVQGCVP